MKLSNKSSDNTSFHNVTFNTTVKNLIEVLGEPQWFNNTGRDKVNFTWTCETKEGKVVTIYDWKEYRSIKANEVVAFHLGSKNPIDSIEGKLELKDLFNN